MNKKVISLSLAAIMSSQSMVYANVDRTSIVTSEAIADAKENLAILGQNLAQLDKELDQIEKKIKARDNSGKFTNALTIAGAGIGIGLSVLAGMSLKIKSSSAGSGMIAILGVILSSIASVGTGLTSATSLKLQKDIDTKEIDTALSVIQSQIQSNMNEYQDNTTKVVLSSLNETIEKTRASIKDYQQDENSTDLQKIYSNFGLVVGTAITATGLMTKSGGKLLVVGSIVNSTSNLTQIIAGMSSSQAELVLEQIYALRSSLRMNMEILK